MDIKGNLRRILKYLSKLSERESVYPTKLYRCAKYNSRIDLDSDLESLYNFNLIGKDDENVFITPTGRNFINQIEEAELAEIYKDIFSDYQLAIIKYFFKRDEPLYIEDLPKAFAQNVETYHTNGSNDYNLIQYLEFTKKQFFNCSSRLYELNSNGKQYLQYLLSEEEKKMTPIFSTINIKQVEDNSTHIHGNDNKVIAGKSTVSDSQNENKEDDKETKALSKESNMLSRRNITIAIITILVSILIAIWQSGCLRQPA